MPAGRKKMNDHMDEFFKRLGERKFAHPKVAPTLPRDRYHQLMKHALDETLVKLSHQLEQAFGLNEEGVTVDDIEITVACILALTKRLLKKPEIIEVED